MQPKYINITGNIGVGATTLCQWLSKRFHWCQVFSEAHNSPFLQTFYHDKGNFAFQNQVYIILQSLRQQRQLDFKTQTICQDYTIYEHNDVYSKTMFSQRYIDSQELVLLNDLFDTNSRELRKPDLLLYLHADIDTLLKRIKSRSRAIEQKIDNAYLEQLQKYFGDFVRNWQLSPAVTIESDKLNLSSKEDIETLEKQLARYLDLG